MPDQLEQDLARVLELLECATPGPWDSVKRNDPEAPASIISGMDSGLAYAVAMCPRFRGDDWSRDADAIVCAVNLLRQHGAALLAALSAERRLRDGYVMVPRDLPCEPDYIAVGTRTEKGEQKKVWLYYTEEGGGWYQWGTSPQWAKHFKSEKGALSAARSAPGPWYDMPELATVTTERVESPKAKKYRAMIQEVIDSESANG